jgi:hypothetical protein
MANGEGGTSERGGGQPSIATRVLAPLFVGLFVASLIWIVVSEPIPVRALGALPLQYLVSLITVIPSAFGLRRLFRNRPSPEGLDRMNARRPRPIMVAVDVFAWASIALFLGFGLWIVGGGAMHFTQALGRLPVEALIVIVCTVPAVFGVIWLVLRNARQLTAAVERLRNM